MDFRILGPLEVVADATDLQHEAVDLARKAVELEDRDHRAHCILGVAQLYARDYEAARVPIVMR